MTFFPQRQGRAVAKTTESCPASAPREPMNCIFCARSAQRVYANPYVLGEDILAARDEHWAVCNSCGILLEKGQMEDLYQKTLLSFRQNKHFHYTPEFEREWRLLFESTYRCFDKTTLHRLV